VCKDRLDRDREKIVAHFGWKASKEALKRRENMAVFMAEWKGRTEKRKIVTVPFGPGEGIHHESP
jgi:hypothetical protein